MPSALVPDGAVWIGSDHAFDLHETYLNFRADVTLEPARAARFQITTDSRYRLWINGVFVARGPQRSWPQAMAVDDLDVTAHLRPGVNHLAVQVYSPGYSHFAHVTRAAAGWVGGLVVDGQVWAISDRTWGVRRDASWAAEVARVSIYGTGMERRDMALAVDWQDAPAEDWARARVVQGQTGPIWASLKPRDLPLLTEDLAALDQPWQTRLGPTPPENPDPHQDLRAAFAACPPGPLPDRLPAGQTAIWVFDLGHSQTCVAGAKVRALGGERLTISYAEKLRDGALLLPDPATYCRMRPTDRATLRPGPQEVEGFTLRGGRYLIFRLDAVADLDLKLTFHARLHRYPLPDLPKPADKVTAMCQRTILSCLQDGFVDSIWRESSQWLGDVVAEAFALQALSNDARALRLAIDMAAMGAAPDGVLPSVLPGDVPAYVVTDYNFSWVELLALYADHPGAADAVAVIDGHWPTLQRLLARFEQDRAADGLIRSQPGRRLFLDWSAQGRDEPNLTYNLRHLFALQIAARLGAPRHPEDAARWADAARQVQDRLRALLHVIGQWTESPGGPPASQLALSLLILTDTVTGAQASIVADAVAARSRAPGDAPGQMVLASPFMHHYVFQALHHLGRDADIAAIIARRWGDLADSGHVTTPENWNIDFPDGSACHGFSAHPLGWLAKIKR